MNRTLLPDNYNYHTMLHLSQIIIILFGKENLIVQPQLKKYIKYTLPHLYRPRILHNNELITTTMVN